MTKTALGTTQPCKRAYKRRCEIHKPTTIWDENKHELYSNVYSKLVTPERTLEGAYFRSDERMTKYYVSNSRGSFEKTDIAGSGDTITTAPDTVKANIRQQAKPIRRMQPNQ